MIKNLKESKSILKDCATKYFSKNIMASPTSSPSLKPKIIGGTQHSFDT